MSAPATTTVPSAPSAAPSSSAAPSVGGQGGATATGGGAGEGGAPSGAETKKPASAEGAAQGVPAAAPSQTTPSPVPATPRRFKVVAGGGKEIEVGPEDIARAYGASDFDALATAMGGEENALRSYRAHRTMQWNAMQAGQREKQLEAIRERAAQDPNGALEDALKTLGLNVDLDKTLEERLERRFRLETMTPEQRELHELREKDRRREAEIKRQQETQQKEQRQTQLKQRGEQIRAAVSKAGLPESPFFFERAALRMMQNDRLPDTDPSKISNLDAEGATKAVLGEFLGEVSWLISKLGVEQMDELLGDEMAKKYREHSVAKFKAQPPPAAPAQSTERSERDRDESGRFRKSEPAPKTFADMMRT